MASRSELPPLMRRCLTDTAPFDLLIEDIKVIILQSLPSLLALVRAACTCRRWLCLASDPAFRRRFRPPPPPVLGLFFDPTCNTVPAIPSFSPVRHDDADLAKVILAGDFLLTPLYVNPHFVSPNWLVADSCCGQLLLFDWTTLRIALVYLLQKKVDGYFDIMELDFDETGPHDHLLEPCLICFEELPPRLWIFFILNSDRRVRLGLFSDIQREGMLLPWLDALGRPSPNPNDNLDNWLDEEIVAGVFIYWFYKNYRLALILDSRDLRLYEEEIPPSVYGQGAEYYALDEYASAVDGPYSSSLFIVYAVENTVHCLIGGPPGSVAAPWVLSSVVKDLGPHIESLIMDLHLQLHQDNNQLVISGLRNGFIYFTTSRLSQNLTTWFCSLSLETGQVKRLLWRIYDASFQPYIMSWSHFLLGDPDDDDSDDGDEGPSDSSKRNTNRRHDGKDGRSSTQQMKDLASGPFNGKQRHYLLGDPDYDDIDEGASDSSVGNTNRRQDRQDEPSSTQQMKDLASDSFNGKQLTEQTLSS